MEEKKDILKMLKMTNCVSLQACSSERYSQTVRQTSGIISLSCLSGGIGPCVCALSVP